jgi:small subunit ribosomal protein S16
MLAIRFLRSGRTNKAFFRVVVTESSRPPKSGFLKVLGWYDPHTKETSLNKEEIVGWMDKGAKASNSVAKLLNSNGIKHKMAEFKKDTEKAKKSKGDEKAAKPAPKPAETEEKAEAPAEEAPVETTQEKAEEPKAEEKSEESTDNQEN